MVCNRTRDQVPQMKAYSFKPPFAPNSSFSRHLLQKFYKNFIKSKMRGKSKRWLSECWGLGVTGGHCPLGNVLTPADYFKSMVHHDMKEKIWCYGMNILNQHLQSLSVPNAYNLVMFFIWEFIWKFNIILPTIPCTCTSCINRSNHISLQAWIKKLNVQLITAFPKSTTLQSIKCWHADLGIEFLSNKTPSTHKWKCTPTLHHFVPFRAAKWDVI